RAPPTSADEHATHYPAAIHPSLGPAFEQEVVERREHLERLGIRGMTMTLTVLQRAAHQPGWTDTCNVGSIQALSVTSRRIDKLMAARTLPARREALLSAR